MNVRVEKRGIGVAIVFSITQIERDYGIIIRIQSLWVAQLYSLFPSSLLRELVLIRRMALKISQ